MDECVYLMLIYSSCVYSFSNVLSLQSLAELIVEMIQRERIRIDNGDLLLIMLALFF